LTRKVIGTLGGAAALCCAFGAIAGSAGAAASIDSAGVHADVTLDTAVVDESTRFVNAQITIVTGPKAFRTRLQIDSPRYTRYLRGKPAMEGATMRLLGLSGDEGEYRIFSSGSGGEVGDSCTVGYEGDRVGVESDDMGWVLGMAAHQTVVLDMKFEIIGDAPWLNTSYSPIVGFFPPAHGKHVFRGDFESYPVPKGAVTFRKAATLRPPSPIVALPLGGRVDFRIDGKKRALPAGKPVPMSGRLVPPLAGQRINIAVGSTSYYEGPLPTDVVAQVTTDTAGNFTYSGWRPRKGRYLINASYPGQSDSTLAPDAGCPLGLAVYGK
jgi:hypothetical protein